ncbi:MAG: DNRLRE domain-containing protein [Chloroflexi bacterium]|nr:DNRLRE domain-containing protein [Chloroflexota bacterium]
MRFPFFTKKFWGCCLVLLAIIGLSNWTPPPPRVAVAASGSTLYLPLAQKNIITSAPLSGPIANAPYFATASVTQDRFSEMGIFWFGRVRQPENFVDVRVGYNDTDVYIYWAIFDQYFWYNPSPTPADLTNWDATTLYLDLNGNGNTLPGTTAYQFVSQFSQPSTNPQPTQYQASYRGNGSVWQSASVPFVTTIGAMGEGAPNSGNSSRGWAASYRIPFASLGLSGKPTTGTIWRMALIQHDRDDAAGATRNQQIWFDTQAPDNSRTWGRLRFGVPTYTPPASTGGATVTIRHRLNNAVVPDLDMGGANDCGDGYDYWTQWGDRVRPNDGDLASANQSNIADWPCFGKIYVTFPLDQVPTNSVIVSATLTLYQFGNSGDLNSPNPNDRPQPSPIQVLTVAQDWNDQTLSWNNAPRAVENFSYTWVPGLAALPGWPGVPRVWDVSLPVAQARAAGAPLRLAIYTADGNYHTGRYFVSSDTGDWNATGRPTLHVTWGNPQ